MVESFIHLRVLVDKSHPHGLPEAESIFRDPLKTQPVLKCTQTNFGFLYEDKKTQLLRNPEIHTD